MKELKLFQHVQILFAEGPAGRLYRSSVILSFTILPGIKTEEKRIEIVYVDDNRRLKKIPEWRTNFNGDIFEPCPETCPEYLQTTERDYDWMWKDQRIITKDIVMSIDEALTHPNSKIREVAIAESSKQHREQ